MLFSVLFIDSNNWLQSWQTRHGQMLTIAVCIAAWLPFLFPKRGTQGVNSKASQYRWTPRRSPPLQRQNKGRAYRIWFPNSLSCSNKLKQAVNCRIAPVRPSHSYTSQDICNALWLQDNDQLSISHHKSSEKYWTDLGDRFQDVTGLCGLSSKVLQFPWHSRPSDKNTSLHLHLCPTLHPRLHQSILHANGSRTQHALARAKRILLDAFVLHLLPICHSHITVWNYDNCVIMHKTRTSQESTWELAAILRSVFPWTCH